MKIMIIHWHQIKNMNDNNPMNRNDDNRKKRDGNQVNKDDLLKLLKLSKLLKQK